MTCFETIQWALICVGMWRAVDLYTLVIPGNWSQHVSLQGLIIKTQLPRHHATILWRESYGFMGKRPTGCAARGMRWGGGGDLGWTDWKEQLQLETNQWVSLTGVPHRTKNILSMILMSHHLEDHYFSFGKMSLGNEKFHSCIWLEFHC